MAVCNTIMNFLLISVPFGIHFTSTEAQDNVKRACVPTEPTLSAMLQSECFVDKSLFIQEFYNLKWNLNLVSAPKGFGKTANLQMLKTFLEIQDGQYRPGLTKGCTLIKEHNLDIYSFNNYTFFNKFCGKQPVLYVDFKPVTGRTFSQILSSLKDIVHETFMQHKYLRYLPKMLDREVRFMYDYVRPTYKNLTTNYLLNYGFRYLTELLYKIFHKRTVVLIDNYDAPIWHMLDYRIRKQHVERSIEFIDQLMTPLLKDNNYVESALINTYVRAPEGLWNYSGSILHLPFLGKHPLVKYYGLTSEEVDEKLTKFNIGRSGEVKDYYNGYGTEVGLYRTESVLKFMQNEDLKSYFRFENLDRLFLQPEVVKLITKLLDGEEVLIDSYNQKLTVKDLLDLKEIFRKRTCNESEAKLFMYFLLIHGHFNSAGAVNNQIALNIPNKEIRQYLYNAIHNITVI